MVVKDAAADGSSGMMGRLGANLKDAAVSAGGEGLAAFNEGADSRIGSFKSEMALRGALSGQPAQPSLASFVPTSTDAPQNAQSSKLSDENAEGSATGGGEAPMVSTPSGQEFLSGTNDHPSASGVADLSEILASVHAAEPIPNKNAPEQLPGIWEGRG